MLWKVTRSISCLISDLIPSNSSVKLDFDRCVRPCCLALPSTMLGDTLINAWRLKLERPWRCNAQKFSRSFLLGHLRSLISRWVFRRYCSFHNISFANLTLCRATYVWEIVLHIWRIVSMDWRWVTVSSWGASLHCCAAFHGWMQALLIALRAALSIVCFHFLVK